VSGTDEADALLRGPPDEGYRGFGITRTMVPGALRLKLTGELDLENAPIAEHHIRRAEEEALDLALDLRGLTFMDAAGLGVVIGADRRARGAGRRVVVCVGSGCVRRLIELTRAERSLEIVDDLDRDAPSRNGGSLW
jgi:anti-sigma B factor antagonist